MGLRWSGSSIYVPILAVQPQPERLAAGRYSGTTDRCPGVLIRMQAGRWWAFLAHGPRPRGPNAVAQPRGSCDRTTKTSEGLGLHAIIGGSGWNLVTTGVPAGRAV